MDFVKIMFPRIVAHTLFPNFGKTQIDSQRGLDAKEPDALQGGVCDETVFCVNNSHSPVISSWKVVLVCVVFQEHLGSALRDRNERGAETFEPFGEFGGLGDEEHGSRRFPKLDKAGVFEVPIASFVEGAYDKILVWVLAEQGDGKIGIKKEAASGVDVAIVNELGFIGRFAAESRCDVRKREIGSDEGSSIDGTKSKEPRGAQKSEERFSRGKKSGCNGAGHAAAQRKQCCGTKALPDGSIKMCDGCPCRSTFRNGARIGCAWKRGEKKRNGKADGKQGGHQQRSCAQRAILEQGRSG